MSQYTIKNKSELFGEKRELSLKVLFHNWLLILAGIVVFFVLPTLFLWSSLDMIHPKLYGDSAITRGESFAPQKKLL